jgi:hypothetical protein
LRVTASGSTGLKDRFNRLADQLTTALGSLPALIASVVLVLGWAATGPLFGFSDTWQLFINTTTTVITFWMVWSRILGSLPVVAQKERPRPFDGGLASRG